MKARKLDMAWGRLAWYEQAGVGVPLLFLHGTGCDSADWDRVLRALPARTHCLLVDFRGHGRSDVPSAPFTVEDLTGDVIGLLHFLSLRRVCLAGHSLGGMVALAVARRSAAPKALVLFEGWTCLRAAGAAFEPGRMYAGLGTAAVTAIRRKDTATRRRFPPEVWKLFWRSVERFDAGAFLRKARIPIVEVYGAAGRRPSVESLLQVPFRSCIHWRWVKRAGHYLPHACPADTAAACRLGLSMSREWVRAGRKSCSSRG